jgi:hypothetical protein
MAHGRRWSCRRVVHPLPTVTRFPTLPKFSQRLPQPSALLGRRLGDVRLMEVRRGDLQRRFCKSPSHLPWVPPWINIVWLRLKFP